MSAQNPMKRMALMRAGVRNLKEFGYPAATVENILTDMIFSAFFKSMLEDNKGKGVDPEINALLAEIAANKQPEGRP